MMRAIFEAVFSIFLIQLVTSQCPENCKDCSDTMQCLSCKVGHWSTNSRCLNKCSNNCTNLNCDEYNGYCYSCVNGTYGPWCNLDCRLCKNGQCGLRECTTGCKDGYYKYISSDNSYCFPCQDNCQQCLGNEYCTFCDTGYFIFKYTYTTEPYTPTASCISCRYFNTCDLCSQLSNCSQCSYNKDYGKLACEHCAEGLTLINNQCVKNIPCGSYCLNGCTPNGVCNGCIDGRTGNTCNYLCGGMCGKCSQTSHTVCQTCKNGFYTSTCAIPCPQNCATGKCDFNNGSCLNGCLSGFWGDSCGYKCSDHCTQSECTRDGTCTRGCADGYGGLYCNITMMTTKASVSTTTLSLEFVTSSTSSESSSGVFTVNKCQGGSSISGPVLGGAVTGAVLITALLVGSIAFFLHRRISLRTRTTNTELRADTMYYNTCSMTTANGQTGDSGNVVDSEITTVQTQEASTYEQLSATNTEHAYSAL